MTTSKSSNFLHFFSVLDKNISFEFIIKNHSDGNIEKHYYCNSCNICGKVIKVGNTPLSYNFFLCPVYKTITKNSDV